MIDINEPNSSTLQNIFVNLVRRYVAPRDIWFVVGYQGSQIRHKFATCNTIDNLGWSGRNNSESFLIGLEYVNKKKPESDIAIMNGDAYHSKQVYDALVNQQSVDLMFVEPKYSKEQDSEDMKVRIDSSNRITKVSKSIDLNNSFGEFVGITFIKPTTVERLIHYFSTFRRDSHNAFVRAYYEDIIQYHIRDLDFTMYDISRCGTGGWSHEIDTREDIQELRKRLGIAS